MSRARAYAKINLGLVVGPRRADGKHELVTVLQRVALHDVLDLEPGARLEIHGFEEDTIVRNALELLATEAGVEPSWRVHIEKRIPVAAGLGGGSSDAATALALANASLPAPLDGRALHDVAARVGADVPFFLREGAQLATGDGTELTETALPAGYLVVLVVPRDRVKESTGQVYASFDERKGADGFEERSAAFMRAVTSVFAPSDLAQLPRNDLVSSPLVVDLEALGSFRADVSGAGPTVYGLFERADQAHAAADALGGAGWTLVTRPVAR